MIRSRHTGWHSEERCLAEPVRWPGSWKILRSQILYIRLIRLYYLCCRLRHKWPSMLASSRTDFVSVAISFWSVILGAMVRKNLWRTLISLGALTCVAVFVIDRPVQ